MHASSHRKMQLFVETYLASSLHQPLEVLDFGSQQVNPASLTYRTLFEREPWRYTGLDIEAGHNVHIAVENPYDWKEVASNTFDVVVSGQAFEHVEYFWASAFEIGRVLRPGGLTMLIAPSGGYEHRFPVDCWRFYRDGFAALGRHLGFEVIDAYTDWGNGAWEDSVLVARKPLWDRAALTRYERRAALQRALMADDPQRIEAVEITELPAPSAIPAPEPGRLSARLADRSLPERVIGATLMYGERMAGERGRELAHTLRSRLTKR